MLRRVAEQRTTRVRLPAAERRALILQAAREVFLQDGFIGARTRLIAERSNINEAVLYKHFASKDELFQAAVLEPLGERIVLLSEQVQAILDDEDREDRVALLEALERVLLDAMREIVPLLGVALFSGRDVGHAYYREHVYGGIGGGLAAQLGQLGLPERPAGPARLVTFLLGMALGPALDAHFRGVRLNTARIARQAATMLVHGLAAPPRRSRVRA